MIGKTLGHYQISEKLGEGGMGEVYRAEDTNLSRQVAIKTLPAEFAHDPERLARFEREAKLLAPLNHPNIAAIHGLEEAERKAVPRTGAGRRSNAGRAASERAPASRPLKDALEVCRQIAEGLEYAHGKGIIHRDLKPSNVKITPDGKLEDPRLRPGPGAATGRGRGRRKPLAHDHGWCNQGGRNSGDSRLHEPGAGAREDAGPAHRHLGTRLPPVRDARGTAGVPRGDDLGHAGGSVCVRSRIGMRFHPKRAPGSKTLCVGAWRRMRNQRLHAVADVRLEIQAIASEPAIAVGRCLAQASRTGTRHGNRWLPQVRRVLHLQPWSLPGCCFRECGLARAGTGHSRCECRLSTRRGAMSARRRSRRTAAGWRTGLDARRHAGALGAGPG